MSILQKIRAFFTPEPAANPEDFGWAFRYEWEGKKRYFRPGYALYESDAGGWVFDQAQKRQPGVIARFDSPLLTADLQYCEAYISRCQTVHSTPTT